jgi:predicted amidohydrolase
MKIAAVQMNSRDNKEENVQKALQFIKKAAEEGANIVVLPEYVNFLKDDPKKVEQAEPIPGPTSQAFMNLAKELGIYIHCGSILEEAEPTRAYNTSLLISDQGEIISKYRKIHLFDIEIEGRVSAKESNTIKPGEEIVTVQTPFANIGLSICYDLRFPELYRSLALQGAEILCVPAAFTLYTGIHHWEVLLRARAIENQCYVIAAGQIGSYPPGRTNFGSTMIIDPWGTVIARAPEEEGVITANISMESLRSTRENIPCYAHRKPALYQMN